MEINARAQELHGSALSNLHLRENHDESLFHCIKITNAHYKLETLKEKIRSRIFRSPSRELAPKTEMMHARFLTQKSVKIDCLSTPKKVRNEIVYMRNIEELQSSIDYRGVREIVCKTEITITN